VTDWSLRKGIGLGRNAVRKSWIGNVVFTEIGLSSYSQSFFLFFVPRVQKIFALVEYLRVIFLPTL